MTSNRIHKGEIFQCTNTVIMDNGDIAYMEGKSYVSEDDDCITDEQGDMDHIWFANEWGEYFKRI